MLVLLRSGCERECAGQGDGYAVRSAAVIFILPSQDSQFARGNWHEMDSIHPLVTRDCRTRSLS